MQRPLLILLLISLAFSSYGQKNKEVPTIQVVGSSKISVKPDIGILVISIKSHDMNFSEAIVGLNKKTVDVSNQIAAIGFKADEIKTTDFQVNEHTVYRRGESVDSGYVATQNVKVEFLNNKETITKILNTFSKSQTDFTLNFNFKLSDELREKVQDQLVQFAIKSSNEKAKLIAESSGVRLGKIKEINYGNNYYAGMREVEDKAEYEVAAAGAPSEAMIGFTPNDLMFSDNVLIIWKIK
ncbi:SIMPL domain-containing protein [Pontibacter arcticus]|uniref:DUF541 domain-containing protein n=1 Tax=Pontibacter arcticus TaxID=2080288 RepID=A0A364REA6_9BACT|nr:SIMPL domain-containing protein [Pontibacter arcticus]RAU82612.1 hypothetical protein DP923_12670 [Pontibacter arcticus]